MKTPPAAVMVCRARAQEARRAALAYVSPEDLAMWLEVATVWDMAADAPDNDTLRQRAEELAGRALLRAA